ncbi:MAG: type II toxin-antitoxin system RelE/ParE family toxin [Bacteroidia bacterium]|nr:type II toxin-antitoxin system RelE/ParE family toxin [Bacteroidia bacterium]
MGKRKIVWNEDAKNDLQEITEYFNKRNGSNTYSKKLIKELKQSVKLLLTNNKMGKKVEDDENLRVIITSNYKIFYEIKEKEIEILLVWDCRRNPDDLKLE